MRRRVRATPPDSTVRRPLHVVQAEHEEAAVKTRVLVLATLVFCPIASGIGRAQAPAIAPATVGSPMPDFTLPAFQGGTVTLSALKGKTVVLVFPRGYAAPGAWCHVCNYKYSSQNTLDRPGIDHVARVVEWVKAGAGRH